MIESFNHAACQVQLNCQHKKKVDTVSKLQDYIDQGLQSHNPLWMSTTSGFELSEIIAALVHTSLCIIEYPKTLSFPLFLNSRWRTFLFDYQDLFVIPPITWEAPHGALKHLEDHDVFKRLMDGIPEDSEFFFSDYSYYEINKKEIEDLYQELYLHDEQTLRTLMMLLSFDLGLPNTLSRFKRNYTLFQSTIINSEEKLHLEEIHETFQGLMHSYTISKMINKINELNRIISISTSPFFLDGDAYHYFSKLKKRLFLLYHMAMVKKTKFPDTFFSPPELVQLAHLIHYSNFPTPHIEDNDVDTWLKNAPPTKTVEALLCSDFPSLRDMYHHYPLSAVLTPCLSPDVTDNEYLNMLHVDRLQKVCEITTVLEPQALTDIDIKMFWTMPESLQRSFMSQLIAQLKSYHPEDTKLNYNNFSFAMMYLNGKSTLLGSIDYQDPDKKEKSIIIPFVLNISLYLHGHQLKFNAHKHNTLWLNRFSDIFSLNMLAWYPKYFFFNKAKAPLDETMHQHCDDLLNSIRQSHDRLLEKFTNSCNLNKSLLLKRLQLQKEIKTIFTEKDLDKTQKHIVVKEAIDAYLKNEWQQLKDEYHIEAYYRLFAQSILMINTNIKHFDEQSYETDFIDCVRLGKKTNSELFQYFIGHFERSIQDYYPGQTLNDMHLLYYPKTLKMAQEVLKEIQAAFIIQAFFRAQHPHISKIKSLRSCILLQAVFRGWHIRKDLAQKNDAAVVIQNIFQSLKQAKALDRKKRKAIIMLQARYQGYSDRKKNAAIIHALAIIKEQRIEQKTQAKKELKRKLKEQKTQAEKELKRKLKDQKEQLVNKDTRIAQTEKSLKQVREKTKMIQADFLQLQKKSTLGLKKQQRDKAQFIAQHQKDKIALAQLRAQIKSKDASISQGSTDSKKMQQTLSIIRLKQKADQENITALHQALDTQSSKYKAIKADLSVAQQEITRLNHTVVQLNARLNPLTAQHAAIRAESRHDKDQIAHLNAELVAAQKTIQAFMKAHDTFSYEDSDTVHFYPSLQQDPTGSSSSLGPQ